MANKPKTIKIKGKKYDLPIFIPDATRAVVKSIDSIDMKEAGVRGAVVNTYHLMSDPGTSTLKKFGGVKDYMNFDGLITSDSGGWQVFSLIHRNNIPGKITDAGVTFSIGGAKKKLFSPEKSIQVQFDIGSDIIICLDDFTPPNATYDENLKTVERTTRWAKRCKIEYEKQLKNRKLDDTSRPLLFAVIQGALDKELRKKSAEELIEIGFDGYGFGGYVVDENGNLDLDISEYIAGLIPEDNIAFALGTGSPWEIAALYDYGWDIFDCTLPTRDARHKRLYTFKKEPKTRADLKDKNFYEYINIHREKYYRDDSPISEHCDCHTCKNYTKAYLNHLFRINDTSAYRLATIHNLRFYNRVIELLTKLD